MAIIAKFSNGFTDEYKGRRAVKAAWAIIRKSDGKVLASGHSLDVGKARKTAESNYSLVARSAGVTAVHFDAKRGMMTVARLKYWNDYARSHGLKDWAEGYRVYAEDVAKCRVNVDIEIIEL